MGELDIHTGPPPGSSGGIQDRPPLDSPGVSGGDGTVIDPTTGQRVVDPGVGHRLLGDIQETLKGLTGLTPQQQLIANQRERARLEATFPDLPYLESPPELTQEQMETLGRSTPTIVRAYALYQVINAAIAKAEAQIKQAEDNAARAGGAGADANTRAAGEAAAKAAAEKAAADAKAAQDATAAAAREGAIRGARQTAADQAAANKTSRAGGAEGNRFLTGTQYVALNEAIALCARAMNQMNVLEAEHARALRVLELDNVNRQVRTIMDEGAMKQQMMLTQAYTKLAFALASGVMHWAVGGAGAAGAVAAQSKMQTLNGILSGLGEAASKMIESSYQVDLSGFEATKTIQRDYAEAIKGQRQKCQELINNNRDALTSLLKELTDAVANLKRALGLQRG